jgi:hypothetical protein
MEQGLGQGSRRQNPVFFLEEKGKERKEEGGIVTY